MALHSSSGPILRNSVLLRQLGLGRDTDLIPPKWEHMLGAAFASRPWRCSLLTPPSALLHMLPNQFHGGTGLCPSLRVAAGRWGTCMPSAGVKVPTLEFSSPFGCSELDPASACAPLLQDCLCLLHVRNSDLVCTTCVLACMFGRREPAVFLDLGP